GFWSWGRSRCWLSLSNNRSCAAEVQTNTNASLPFGITMVQTVQSINASFDEEVFVQVVLDAETSNSHGRAVINVSTELLQLLVGKAAGNVWAQSTLSEVVNGFNVGQLAVDVCAIVRAAVNFKALVRTQTDVQQDVVGDEVTQAATHQCTVGQVM